MMRTRPRLLVLLCVLLLSSCGFRLAGTNELPETLARMSIADSGFSKSQLKALRRTLTSAGVELVQPGDDTAVQLSVTLQSGNDQQLATSAASGEKVQRISRGLTFNVKSAEGNVVAAQRTLSQQRDVVLDDDNLASSNREKESVERELEQALYDQLVRQLARLQ